MAPGGAAWRKTVARFGDAILRRDQTIDRERLGRIVFADPSARHFMNALVHPLVMAEEKRSIARLEREGRAGIYVSEAALTIEAGYAPFSTKSSSSIAQKPSRSAGSGPATGSAKPAPGK